MAARKKVSFATCNLYNLNLPGVAIYNDTNGWPADQYNKKIDWLSRTLRRLKADCFGFQELWHKEALQAVFAQAGLDADYHLLVPKDQVGQHIVCAGAVRKEYLVDEPEWIEDFPDKMVLESGGGDAQTPDIAVKISGFSRPVLHFKIKPRTKGSIIHIFVAHLKSKRPTQLYRESWYKADREYQKKHAVGIGSAISTIRRTAEAAALRMILTDLMKNSDIPTVVLGDLNDGQLSNTINIISGQPNYLIGLSSGGSDIGLYTVGTLQEYRSLRDVYYTHSYNNQRESLDHILVSQEFYDNSRRRIWAFDGMEIMNDHLNHEDHKADGSSDHGIVKATFKYQPARS